MRRLTEAAKVERIVDYAFERDERSNVLAIHPTLPLIAYLINIQRTKISKGWTSGNESAQSPLLSLLNGQNNINQSNNSISSSNSAEKPKTVSIRIIDYNTRQRCLAKGMYHARPADCAFTINSLICSQAEINKLAIVDRLANIYLYDVGCFLTELTATRIAVIRGPGQEMSPMDSINLVWCPFVPCEDFDDGDGGLRLALATNSKIEIFAIDRLQGRTGELQRNDLKGAYKCIQDAHKTNIVALSISPDCSTISAAALDNRVTFFSSDIDDNGGQRCLHNWEAGVTDKSSISKLFFLDDYPKLLKDSTMKFWGTAFIGTRSGQMLLVDLRTWRVYQTMSIGSEISTGPKNFDYRIDLTSRHIIALNGNLCYVVQVAMSNGLPKIVRTTSLALQHPIYSFVIKYKSEDELELFTITAYSLERYTINLNAITSMPTLDESNMSTACMDGDAGAMMRPNVMIDRMVEALFSKLNTAFSQGLEEFLNDVRCEVDGLCRDVRKLQQQLQELRQK